MEEKIKNKLVKDLEDGLLKKITDTINNELGTQALFEVKTNYYNWCGWKVKLEESGTSSTELLTSNKLLKQIFEQSKLTVNAWFYKGTTGFTVSVNYKHSYDKGSNGVDVMCIYVSGDKITVEK